MDLCDAVNLYVTGRAARGEIRPGSAADIRCRLGGLVDVAGPGARVEELDRATVAAWHATIGRHRPATRRAYLSTLRTFCRWAAAEGLISLDPSAGTARVREPRRASRALSDASIARLRLVLPDDRAELIVALMFRMGLRCVEVARLRDSDYDLAAAEMTVTGKFSDQRPLPVPAPVVAALAGWAAGGGSGRSTTVGISANTISKLVSGWMDKAGLKTGPYDGVSAHALRHTMASNMLDRCGNVHTVQQALGHQSLATTERYLRAPDMAAMRAAMDTA